MAKKKTKKEPPKDGLGPDNLKRIHKAVRQVWQWSYMWRLAKKRAIGPDGFPRCEKCKKRVPKVAVDHKHPVGEVGGVDYIAKMFVPSKMLQCLCPKCHRLKTKKDNAKTRKAKIKPGKRKPEVQVPKDIDGWDLF